MWGRGGRKNLLFLKKKKQKDLIHLHRGRPIESGANGRKFFGSFFQKRMAFLLQGFGDFRCVVAHHGDVAGGWALGFGQCVGVEAAADGDAGFGGQRAQAGAGAGVFQEEGADILALDLGRKGGEFAGGGFGVAPGAGDGEHVDTVGLGEVGEGFVRGDDAAAGAGNGGEEGADFGVQRVELGGVAGGGFGVGGGAGGVGGGEAVADVGDVELGVGDALPGVGVEAAVGVAVAVGMAAVLVGGLEGCDAACGDNGHALETGSLGDAVGPAFEAEAIGDEEAGLGDGLEVGGEGFEAVQVLVGAGEGADGDTIFADALGHVGEDGEAGDDGD